MFDIVAVGEILIDLTQTGVTETGVPRCIANPGGAPANLAVAARRLGARTAFIGKVGQDGFGEYLAGVLAENGVDTAGLRRDADALTTMAVVTVAADGERSFAFYRDNTADVRLAPDEVAVPPTRILHFGSVSLTAPLSRRATMEAVAQAKAMGALVTYDPNYRPALWPSEAEAVAEMKKPLAQADILKVSDEELPLLAGTADPAAGSAVLAGYGIPLVLVTLGERGTFYRMGELTGTAAGYAVTVADTNGAGDTFFGAFLAQLAARGGMEGLSEAELAAMVRTANRAASITCSRSGAIPAMPTAEELTQ